MNTIPVGGMERTPLKTLATRNRLASKLELSNDNRARRKHHLLHNLRPHLLPRSLLPRKEGYLADRLSQQDGL